MTHALLGASLTLGAFLLFLVQPMVARAILPWFGGSSALWTSCMLVFQATLLIGYLYAHVLARFVSGVGQFRIHGALLVASAFLLPPIPDSGWKPIELGHPSTQVVLLVLAVAGLPYLVLSTTSPLVQAWYARALPGRSPYRLYAWSNASSLAALLSYPVAVEPYFTTRQQGMLWSALYLVFVAVCLPAAYAVMKYPAAGEQVAPKADATDPPKPPRRRKASRPAKPAAEPRAPHLQDAAVWMWLAWLASALMLGITNELCQNIAVVPFLWVLPLSLYLVTFVLSFQWDRLYRRRVFLPLSVLSIWAMAHSSYLDAEPSLWLDVGIWSATLFVFCMICHGELVRRQPAREHLTLFYVAVALGGALGGVSVAIVAPHVFASFLELPLAMAAIVTTAGLFVLAGKPAGSRPARMPVAAGAAAGVYLLAAAATSAYVRSETGPTGLVLEQRRNFFGVVRVEEEPADGDHAGVRWLFNGRIVHGAQFRDPGKMRVPTTYFARESGLGLAMAHLPRRAGGRHVGIVGLGAGTIAAYGRVGDRFRFYEINPLVQELAQKYFTFVPQCPCSVDVVIGDARVSLDHESSQEFDLLVLDAFSGDAIPTHLLTAEALQIYLRHLRPGGILACHISNTHINLTPVLRGLADKGGLTGVLVQNDEREDAQVYSADWVLLSRNPDVFDRPAFRAFASPAWSRSPSLAWTDDFSSVASVIGGPLRPRASDSRGSATPPTR